MVIIKCYRIIFNSSLIRLSLEYIAKLTDRKNKIKLCVCTNPNMSLHDPPGREVLPQYCKRFAPFHWRAYWPSKKQQWYKCEDLQSQLKKDIITCLVNKSKTLPATVHKPSPPALPLGIWHQRHWVPQQSPTTHKSKILANHTYDIININSDFWTDRVRANLLCGAIYWLLCLSCSTGLGLQFLHSEKKIIKS